MQPRPKRPHRKIADSNEEPLIHQLGKIKVSTYSRFILQFYFLPPCKLDPATGQARPCDQVRTLYKACACLNKIASLCSKLKIAPPMHGNRQGVEREAVMEKLEGI